MIGLLTLLPALVFVSSLERHFCTCLAVPIAIVFALQILGESFSFFGEKLKMQ
jgi:hypothetical protein